MALSVPFGLARLFWTPGRQRVLALLRLFVPPRHPRCWSVKVVRMAFSLLFLCVKGSVQFLECFYTHKFWRPCLEFGHRGVAHRSFCLGEVGKEGGLLNNLACGFDFTRTTSWMRSEAPMRARTFASSMAWRALASV